MKPKLHLLGPYPVARRPLGLAATAGRLLAAILACLMGLALGVWLATRI